MNSSWAPWRRKALRRAATSLVLALGLAACGSVAPASPDPSPTVGSLLPSTSASESQRMLPNAKDMEEARRFRTSFGLRSDDAWIVQVAADPNASDHAFGIPLTQEEVDELGNRQVAIDAIREVVTQYGLDHPEDWAGAWIDQKRGGILVAAFSGSFERHRTALLSQVHPTAPLEILEVERSLQELKTEAARLDPYDPWLATVPAVLESAGVDEQTNSVLARISSVNPDARRLFEEHFGWQGFFMLESDGTGALLLPRGSLVVRVVDTSGRPMAGLRCIAIPDMSGAYEAPLDAPTTDSAGRCRIDLPATGYWVRLDRTQDPTSTIGIGRAVVVANRVSEVLLKVDADD